MRDALISKFLAKSPWHTWAVNPITGDASARRYFRLSNDINHSVILMDDPAKDTARFANIATFLTLSGFAAPEILLHDPEIGLMVIGDLGQTDFAIHLRKTPQNETQLYTAATNVLIQLHHKTTTLPLGKINQETAPDMIDLAALHYSQTPKNAGKLHTAMHTAFATHVDATPHISLRDFHAENLIWRADLANTDRVGLLDFQDACFAPAGYDLMSLLRDARRDVDPQTVNNCIAQFCTAIGSTPHEMSAHLACISVQRNLRILGIFARLSRQDGKVKYLSLLLRVWTHLMTDLAHPALASLRQTVTECLPPPDATTLKRLQP